MSFGAGVTHCTEMTQWTLSGPGSIDRTEGVPVLYTPPASVAATTTATLTATMADAQPASATITIDPAVMTLAGEVIAASGAPVAGAAVRVGSASATADAAGAFSLSGVSPPYDIYATDPGGLLTSVYLGLRRADPTLVIFDVAPVFPQYGSVTGALSGGAGFPQPTGHETGVTFESAEATAAWFPQTTSASFYLAVPWAGPSSVTGALHALQWQVDGNERPASYDGYGTRPGVTLATGSPVTGEDVALAPVSGQSSVSGTIANPPNDSAAISMFVVLADGARIRVLPPQGDPASFPYAGFQSTFSIPTPSIPGATIDLASRKEYAGIGVYEEAHRYGLAPDATGVAIQFAGLPTQNTPAPDATGIGPGTTFTWYWMPDDPVYVVSFRGPTGSGGYDVFTTAQSLTIPADLPLPSSAACTWTLRGSSAFHTVEDAAGPGGFFAPATAYWIAQGRAWPFTTAP